MRASKAMLLFIAFVATGCAASRNGAAPRPDRNTITIEQIREHQFINAYDAVSSLHANWLTVRGTDSFQKPGEIIVYYDATRLGGVETLRTITSNSIAFIRWFDGIAATNRWGVGHSNGVIFVSSQLEKGAYHEYALNRCSRTARCR